MIECIWAQVDDESEILFRTFSEQLLLPNFDLCA